MNKLTKKILSYVGAVLLMLVLSYAYVPQVLQGKIVNQNDISGYKGMAQEVNEYNSAHPGEPARWTNSMFSGMPTTSFDAVTDGDATSWIYKTFLLGKRPASYLFISLLGAFLMFLALGTDALVAIGGAVAVTFCSYNLQIIQVGHNTKMQALAFAPYVLAAIFYAYSSLKEESRRRYILKALLGGALFALALDIQIKANHQQISYYLAIIILIYAVALFIHLMLSAGGRARAGRFFLTSVILLVLGAVGIGTNANKLLPLYEYTPQTMRGGSELVKASESRADGLDLSYATNWSYGWEELPNLLIPNFNGGSSAGAVNPAKSETYRLLKNAGQKNLREVCSRLPLYWGPQPFTAGPMYMGAITIFLFLLGLLVLKGREKWWVVAATLVAVLLSLGYHFMWFTKLAFEYAPMYNKFRTVSMSLTMLQLTLPVLGFAALSKILSGEVGSEKVRRALPVSYCLTAGVCLILALFPDIAGSFTGRVDAGMADILVSALKADRRALLSADAWRSFALISAAAALLWWGTAGERSRIRMASAAICLLVLVDLWSVGKRYLRPTDFVTPRTFTGQFNQRPVDKVILADPDLSYRVLDLTANVFNDSHASYWHKSIGGYSPAKLQRYQDLIERHLTPEINSLYDGTPSLEVLSMLNMKYIIYDGDADPIENQDAFGNAWFVSGVRSAASAAEEIDFLGEVDLRSTAVIGEDFAWARAAVREGDDSDSIVMTSYEPGRLRYHYSSTSERAVLFSEIYYPDGWTCLLEDGSPVPLFRADWTLRGAVLPAGEHDIVMEFAPSSYAEGRTVSAACSWLLLLIVLLSAGVMSADTLKREKEWK